MKLAIKNDFDSFSHKNYGDTAPSITMILVGAVGGFVGAIVCVATVVEIGFSIWAFMPLLVLLCYLAKALEQGNSAKRLGCTITQDRFDTYHYNVTDGYKAWRTYRKLPADLRATTPKLTVEDIAALSPSEANELKVRLERLQDAYEENQRILRAPKINNILRHIDEHSQSLKESTRAVRELDSGN